MKPTCAKTDPHATLHAFVAEIVKEFGKEGCFGLGMPAFQWIIERYKSLPGIVVRATVGALLGTGDVLSDIVTICTLFGLGLLGPAYALLTMVLLSFGVQVWSAQWRRAASSLHTACNELCGRMARWLCRPFSPWK